MTKQEIFEQEVTKFAKNLYKKLQLNESQNGELVTYDELMDACDTIHDEWSQNKGDEVCEEVLDELGYGYEDIDDNFDEIEPVYTERFYEFACERLIELFPEIDFPEDCDIFDAFEYLGYPTFYDDVLVDSWQSYIDHLSAF